MELYNKIQELLKANEKTKQESIALLELATSTLKKQNETQFANKAQQLEAQFKQAIQDKLENPQFKLDMQARLETLANQAVQTIIPQISQEARTQIDTQQITQEVQESLKEAVIAKLSLEDILSPQELKGLLEDIKTQVTQHWQAQEHILLASLQAQIQTLLEQEQKGLEQTRTQLEQEARERVQQSLFSLVKTQVEGLDFSFLKEQHDIFYPAIEKHLKALFFKELEQDFLKRYWEEHLQGWLEQQAQLKRLKEIEFEAQLHLESLLFSHALKMLQAQEMGLMEMRLKEWQFANDMALAMKRQELIKQGILQEEWLHTKAYKVH
ncbi:hypothetical protein [Helicobacter bizzozeronii]|uniref:hypothetical protein n=1 Tax=Helicobacter bizzozeronii TaxID=56877 RepID=UPI001F285348|nr:hypothetical protein [Helicobacter bizzozeronii]